MQGNQRARKLEQEEVTKALVKLIEIKNAEDKDFVLAKTSEVGAVLRNHLDIDVARTTVKRNGLRKFGYYTTKFDCCAWNDSGDKSQWGLVVKPKQFLEQVED